MTAGTDWSDLPLPPGSEIRGLDAVRLLIAFEDAARARGWTHNTMIEAQMTILDGLELFEHWYAEHGRLIDASQPRRTHLAIVRAEETGSFPPAP